MNYLLKSLIFIIWFKKYLLKLLNLNFNKCNKKVFFTTNCDDVYVLFVF